VIEFVTLELWDIDGDSVARRTPCDSRVVVVDTQRICKYKFFLIYRNFVIFDVFQGTSVKCVALVYNVLLLCVGMLWNLTIGIGIATGYGLDDRGVGIRDLVRSRIFSSPRHPDRFWGLYPAFYPMGTGGTFPRGVKLTTYLQLVPRSRKRGSIHPLPHTS
jgi:hypothetical protein